MIWVVIALLVSLQSGSVSAANRAPWSSTVAHWDDLDSFVSVGQCIASPLTPNSYPCHPAHIARVEKSMIEATGFIAATNTILEVSDAIKKETLRADDLNKLFSKYNYSELILRTRIVAMNRYWAIGIKPYVLSGQFQIHNPSFPLGSISYRQDMTMFASTGWGTQFGQIHIEFGAQAEYVSQKEIAAEATLADFASRPVKELLSRQGRSGAFSNLGTHISWNRVFHLSYLARNFGTYFSGREVADGSLFLERDRVLNHQGVVSYSPKVGPGTLQLGASLIWFPEYENQFSSQYLWHLNYFLGPLSLTSGFRSGVIRTGLSMRIQRYNAAIAQEWKNEIEPGRTVQPRFILSLGVAL